MKKIYIWVIVLAIVFSFYLFHTFVKIQQHNYVVSVLSSNLKHSNILEDRICKINNVRSADKNWFEKYQDDFYFKNILIECDNLDTHIIKVIVKDDAFDVYAYEINGELIYENDLIKK